VPVRIETWFSGPNPAAVVYLSAQSFGDSAGCGTNAPPAGTKWIWVAYVSPGNDPTTGLCSPHAQLGSPEGDKLLADAVATFQGAPPPGASDPPEPSNPPEAAPQPQPVAAELGIPIAIGTLALGLLVLTGAVVIARRRSRPTG
jgi:hypothetical protein